LADVVAERRHASATEQVGPDAGFERVDVGAFAATREFWHGKRVFLTGHTGFKGSWLVVWLAELGANVRGFARPPDTVPSMFSVLDLEHLCDNVPGDVRDQGAVTAALAEFRPDVVIHMAAQPLVRESYRVPVDTFAANIMGTVHVLEACRTCPTVRGVVVVSTDKCYADRQWVWGYRETDDLGGHDPYSASKACVELVAAAYQSSFFWRREPNDDRGDAVAVGTARAGNVIGGGDWAGERLIPDAVRALAKAERVSIRMPHAVRPWQHVGDCLSGYLALARALIERGAAVARPWNFGPSLESMYSVRDVIQMLVNNWGSGGRWEAMAGGEEMRETTALLLDSSRARASLGWRPVLSLEDAVAATAEWYKLYYVGRDSAALRNVTRRQIRLVGGGS
jgi:CDP-glucose 4,6-dehydratase